MATQYQSQSRADYERYLQGMDASMQQKVALTAAHLLGEGWLADMGMGSGTGSEALAALYPNIRVTGVDINPEMVERAAQKYQLPNLDFRAGDIAEICFEEESLDVIFDSSVLHHVTTFNDYDIEQARLAIRNQIRQLKVEGNLIIRDFVRPEEATVWLDLPQGLAPLFEIFSKEFRKLKPEDQRGFSYRELDPPKDDWRRFEVSAHHAVEFVLRKDYTADWDTEVLEEYTYFTQAEFEATFRQEGLRILASSPIRNPWIIGHRFRGKFQLSDTNGTELPFPPTNYLIVGEKVAPDQGVLFEAGAEASPKNYLEFASYKNTETDQLRDLVRRPNTTLDAVPYFLDKGELYVVARRSYGRPLLELCASRLDGCKSPTYVTEPIVIVQQDKALAQTVEEALDRRINLRPDQLRQFHFGGSTYPSPGGLQEEVRPVFIETEPIMVSEGQERARAISARQLLRAAQVGGLPDARLELHCFELFRHLGTEPGSWIGETLRLESQTEPRVCQLQDLLCQRRRVFQNSDESADFLHLGCRDFHEKTSAGCTTRASRLEYVTPTKLSLHTVAVAPLVQTEKGVLLGVVDDDFPAAQCFSGHSNLVVTPAWRAPKEMENLDQLKLFLCQKLESEHGLKARQIFTLGGAYFPSAGATPEVVYPMACDLESLGQTRGLHWVCLSQVLDNFHHLKDGHLKILASRAARALGVD